MTTKENVVSVSEIVPAIDERITDVRFNHPSEMSATRGIDLPLALRMAAEYGGSVDVYLADYKDWFRLVDGPDWRINTLAAALRESILKEVEEGLEKLPRFEPDVAYAEGTDQPIPVMKPLLGFEEGGFVSITAALASLRKEEG